MTAVTAPLLEGTGKKSKDIALDESVYAAEVKPHLVHEAVAEHLIDAGVDAFIEHRPGVIECELQRGERGNGFAVLAVQG